MMNKPLLGCIADDFTGASDLANNLVRSGMRTIQTIGIPKSAQPFDTDAIVIALKSRTISAKDAVTQSLQAFEWLKEQGVEQYYFKYCSTFDSTPQGNIGPVTDALMDAIYGKGQGFTIVCPAFPENNRTVFKGHLFVGDVLLCESGMQNHPLTPMQDANLVRVMQAQTYRIVGLVDEACVSAGADSIRLRFQELQTQGIGIVVVDAICNDDLMHIASALSDTVLITAGSGIAIGLSHQWKARGLLQENVPADKLPPVKGYQAVVSGSCSQATNTQVLDWCKQGLPAFKLDPFDIGSGSDITQKVLAWALPKLVYGPILIYATAPPEEVKIVQAKLGATHAGDLIEQALAKITIGLVQAGVRQLLLAGGETAGAIVQALDINSLIIGPQIDPGVPWTCASSDFCKGDALHISLKSGNFGTNDFFSKSFSFLSG